MNDQQPVKEPPQKTKKRSRILRWFFRSLLAIVILVMSTPFVFRIWALWDFPKMPHPFDVDEFLAEQYAEDENAEPFYATALSRYVEPTMEENSLIHNMVLEEEEVSQGDLARLYEHLQRNESALQAWRKGTLDPYYVPLPLAERTISSPHEAQKLEVLSESAYVKSCILDSQGKHEESREWILAIARNGAQLGHFGCLYDRLIGTEQLRSAYDRLERWSAQPEVSSDLLKQTISDLEELGSRLPANSAVLKGEYVLLLNSIESVDQDDSWLNVYELIGQLDGEDDLVQTMAWTVGQEQFAYRVTAFYFHNLLGAVDLPACDRPEQSEDSGLFDDPSLMTYGGKPLAHSQVVRNIFMPWAELSRILTGGLFGFPDFCDRAEVSHKAILVILAGQAYRRDYGRFPDSLEQLVPEYLDAIPIDPFDGQPMKYNPDAEHPVVYSSYHNRVDDGGTNYDWRTMSSDGPLDYGRRMLSEIVRPQFAP